MITVAGLTPSLDLTFTVDSLRPGAIHRVPDVVQCAGGKALNMARAATTAGGACAVVAVLGGPTGALLTRLLEAEGLDVEVVPSPGDTRTCVSIAANDTGELTEVYQEAPALPESVWAELLARLEGRLRTRPGWLSVSGRAPAGSEDRIGVLVELGRRLGVAVALDVHGEGLGRALAAGPAVLKINRYEAAELLGVPADTELLAMATEIGAGSGAIVVLTDQTAGALAYAAGQAMRAVPPEVVGHYPVGSGDSFLGGLLAALDAGRPLDSALRTATACGVANALVPGQGRFDVATMLELERQVQVQPG